MTESSRQIVLTGRPEGGQVTEALFELQEVPRPQPSDGEVLLRAIYLSLDPAMRGWISAQTKALVLEGSAYEFGGGEVAMNCTPSASPSVTKLDEEIAPKFHPRLVHQVQQNRFSLPPTLISKGMAAAVTPARIRGEGSRWRSACGPEKCRTDRHKRLHPYRF